MTKSMTVNHVYVIFSSSLFINESILFISNK